VKATLVITVPDEFLVRRHAEIKAEFPEWDTPVEGFLVEKLEGIAGDELPIALWGWPVTIEVVA
jgi:hypothetical protein